MNRILTRREASPNSIIALARPAQSAGKPPVTTPFLHALRSQYPARTSCYQPGGVISYGGASRNPQPCHKRLDPNSVSARNHRRGIVMPFLLGLDCVSLSSPLFMAYFLDPV